MTVSSIPWTDASVRIRRISIVLITVSVLGGLSTYCYLGPFAALLLQYLESLPRFSPDRAASLFAPDAQSSLVNDTVHEILPTAQSKSEEVPEVLLATHTENLPLVTKSSNEDLHQAPTIHLVSHRSCSQDQHAACNGQMRKLMLEFAQTTSKIRQISHSHIYDTLPSEVQKDPRWAKHMVCPEPISGLALDPWWRVRNFSAYMAEFKSCPRGRGYWFWKPAIVNMLVRKRIILNEDFILYADPDHSAKHFHRLFLKRKAIAAMRGRCDIVIRKTKFCEHQWTKGDIFRLFGTSWNDGHYGRTQQYFANFWMLKLNYRTRKLLQTWEDLVADLHLVSDEASVESHTDSPFLRESRHDQSLLSMLLKASASPAGSCEEFDRRYKLYPQDPPPSELINISRHPRWGVEGLRVCHYPFGAAHEKL